MSFHSAEAVGSIHIPYQWEYANEALRISASGFVSTDIGKLARQLDNNSLWMLIGTVPTWQNIGGSGGGGNMNGPISATDNAIVRFNGLTGTLVQDSSALVDDSGSLFVPGLINGRDVGIDGYFLDMHLSDLLNPHGTTSAQIGLANVTNDAQLKRSPNDFSIFDEKTTLATTDILLIEDSASGGAKKRVQIGNLQSGPQTSFFGQNYQTAASIARTTTTSSVFQNKVTLITPSLAGTYRIGWTAVIDSAASNVVAEAQLWNATNGVVEGITQANKPSASSVFAHVGGFVESIFFESSKTFEIRFRSPNGSGTVGIQDARIELWRIS